MEQTSRGNWTSRLGFILAAAGSAIGLGNIWRYPYVTGQNGGAAFVLVYLGCVLFIGVSVLIAELALGRHTTLNPVGAIKKISSSRLWPGVGYLGVITGVGILSFYLVVAGWTIGYLFKTAFHTGGTFAEFIHNPTIEIGYFTVFLLLTTLVVLGGVEKGIERWSKILMPLLLLILVGLMVFSLTLEGAGKGVEFYLKPDFSKITGSTILAALGQAFFSLSLGMGTMITYGSYLSKNESIPFSATAVAISDTTIAFLAGLVIFPALFSAGMDPAAGPGLVFNVLPTIFEKMPGGTIVGVFFFILLIIAALTSTVSLLEVPVAFLVDQKKWSRKKAVWVITMITFVMGLPSALSQGTVDFLSTITLPHPNPSLPPLATGFLDIMNFLFGSFSLTIGGLLICIFVGWVWGAQKGAEELKIGASPSAHWYIGLWQILIRFVSPVIILLVLLNLFGIV
ncbi:MAG TPA: sodium-dependent transporter [Bacteroidota bacterium]|nr:sodium-dependent transporter [Bacteroidota bacterium]